MYQARMRMLIYCGDYGRALSLRGRIADVGMRVPMSRGVHAGGAPFTSAAAPSALLNAVPLPSPSF